MRALAIPLAGPSRLGIRVSTITRSFVSTSSERFWSTEPKAREDSSSFDRSVNSTPRSGRSVDEAEVLEDIEMTRTRKGGLNWHKAKIEENKHRAKVRRDHQYIKTMGAERDHISHRRQPIQGFSSDGLGVPDSRFATRSNYDPVKVRHPGAPPKERDLVETHIHHQFKEGGFKDTYYHDPFADTTVSDSVDYLREALYPSIPQRGKAAPVDPVKVVECCQRLAPQNAHASSNFSNPRLTPLEPYVDQIFSVLVPEFSKGPLPTPVLQLEVLETLERCLGRVIHRHESSSDVVEWRKQFDNAADQYAQVLIYQARSSSHDPARLDSMLRHIDRTLENYANTINCYIPVPLFASHVLLMKLSGLDFRPDRRGDFYTFAWPKSELVVGYLRDITESDVTAVYAKRPLPHLPSTIPSLDKILRELCLEDSGAEFARLWRRYRDLYDTSNHIVESPLLAESLRADVLTTFWYRLTYHLAKDRDWNALNWRPVSVNKLKDEIFSSITKPYSAKVLHGMVYAQTQPMAPSPEVNGLPGYTSIDPAQRAKLLYEIWKLAEEGRTRDMKFYGLFVTALGHCNSPGLVRKTWETCIDDAKCRKATEAMGETGSWPPTDFLNQVLAALLKTRGDGTQWAKSLFEQASSETSSVKIDHYTLALMLEQHARTGRVAEMEKIVELGAKRGIEPNSIIYGTLIKGMLKAGQFELVDSTLKLMAENGITPSARLFPTLIAGLCQSGELDGLREAERLLGLARKHGLEITVFSWASLIGGYFTGGWSEDGWEAVRRMDESGVELNRVAYNMIIKEAGKTVDRPGADSIGVQIVKRMIENRVYPGYKTWEALLLPLIKAEKWNTAQSVVDLMEGTRSAKPSADLRKMLFSVQWRRKWKN